MAVFQLGPIIRNRRVELGFSQEDLADGICSVPTLSRIENGERMPTKNHFEMLMQRLGYSAMSLDFFTDRHDFLIHELKFKIRQAYVARDFCLAKSLLAEYDTLISSDSNVDSQFRMLYQVLLNPEQYSRTEKLDMFETALRLTCPSYSTKRIPYVLSYSEIILLNSIAFCYDTPETRHQAISILKSLKTYYDSHVINSEEALRTQPMILYNLSKMLGLAGLYDECIQTCEQAITLARKTSRCTFLGKILYNRAWALLARNHDGDRHAALQAALQARNFFQVMGDSSGQEFVENFIAKNQLMLDDAFHA